MCLDVDIKETYKLLHRYNIEILNKSMGIYSEAIKERHIGYKLLRRQQNSMGFISPVHEAYYMLDVPSISDFRRVVDMDTDIFTDKLFIRINHGIHLYRTLKQAIYKTKIPISGLNLCSIVICSYSIIDFIAANQNELVVKRFTPLKVIYSDGHLI